MVMTVHSTNNNDTIWTLNIEQHTSTPQISTASWKMRPRAAVIIPKCFINMLTPWFRLTQPLSKFISIFLSLIAHEVFITARWSFQQLIWAPKCWQEKWFWIHIKFHQSAYMSVSICSPITLVWVTDNLLLPDSRTHITRKSKTFVMLLITY